MAVSLTNMPVYSLKCSSKPGIFTDNSATGKVVRVNKLTQGSNTAKFQLLEVKMRYYGENCQIASPVVEHSYCSLSLYTPPEDIVELAKHSKAAESNPPTKLTSIVCSKCEGNGAIACTQCKGSGVNSVDHFDGQFKAGGLCWLCRGKRDILCGDCNGAGFIGGFMSTFDE